MDSFADTAARILEIEARQDEALQQLAELERRVEQVLAAFLPTASQSAPPVSNAATGDFSSVSKAA